MRRRNQLQPLDFELLEDLGWLPSELVDTLRLRGTRVRPGRSTRAYPTPHGSIEVQEMEALIRFLGGHYAYFNLTAITHWNEEVVDTLGTETDAEEDALGLEG